MQENIFLYLLYLQGMIYKEKLSQILYKQFITKLTNAIRSEEIILYSHKKPSRH